MRRARAFAAHHARTYRVLGRADRAEDLAVLRPLHAAQNGAALAGLVVGHALVVDLEAACSVEGRVLLTQLQGRIGNDAKPAPLEFAAQFEHLGHAVLRLEVAVARHRARELVFHNGTALVHLPHQHQDRLHHVQRLEARDHHGLSVFLGKEFIRSAADHGGHVCRTDEAVDRHGTPLAHFGRLQDMADGRGREHMAGQHAEILQLLLLGLLHRQCRGRRRGLEADGKKHHLALRIVARNLQRVQRRIHHADVAAARLGLQQREPVGSGNAQRVAVGAQDHAAILCEPDRHVDAPDRQHAHGATGTVNHGDVGREQIAQAVA